MKNQTQLLDDDDQYNKNWSILNNLSKSIDQNDILNENKSSQQQNQKNICFNHQYSSKTGKKKPNLKERQFENQFLNYNEIDKYIDSLSQIEDSDKDEMKQKKVIKRYYKRETSKNFFINFRRFFIQFIQKKCLSSKKTHLIRNLKKKKHMTIKHYKRLFTSIFEKYIQQMFAMKYLQRQFQLSKISTSLKCIYLKKIQIFEKAFKNRKSKKVKQQISQQSQ